MEFQRTTTYHLTAGEPMLIDLQTRYHGITIKKVETTPALTGAFTNPSPTGSPTSNSLSNAHTPAPADPVGILDLFDLATKGLVQFNGHRLTYIISNPGSPRPTSFESVPGQLLTKVTLRRMKQDVR